MAARNLEKIEYLESLLSRAVIARRKAWASLQELADEFGRFDVSSDDHKKRFALALAADQTFRDCNNLLDQAWAEG